MTTIVPPWAVNALVFFLVALNTGFIGVTSWTFRKYARKVDVLEGAVPTMATKADIENLETKMAPLMSRNEFIEQINQIRKDQDSQNRLTRDDRLRMHDENQKAIQALRDDIKETRSDVRAVHQRIDDVVIRDK